MVILKREGLKTTYRSQNPDEIAIIEEALTFDVPGAHWAMDKNEGDPSRYSWDGKKKFYSSKRFFWFGNIERVLDALSENNIKYKIFGYKENDTANLTFSEKFLSEDRDYQRLSIKEAYRVGYGIIKVPTRGGKTFIAAEMIRLKKPKNCLFLTDAADIFNQAPDDLRAINEGLEIGTIQGDIFDIKGVNIGMIQTFQSIFKSNKTKQQRARRKQALDFLTSVDLLIIDEVHEFSSTKRLSIIRKCENAEMILALSATPEKDKGIIHEVCIESITGGVVYEIEEKVLVKKGVLAKNKVLMILNKIPNMGNYQTTIQKGIIVNHKRNSMIMRLIQICEDEKLKTLVMFKSVDHGQYFSKVLNIPFLSGVSKKEERNTTKQDFLSAENGGVLFVSAIWKKGITLPEAEIIINLVGGLESSLALQIRGRVLGVTPVKNKALCIDFFDENEYLTEHSENRVKAYLGKLSKKDVNYLESDVSGFEYEFKKYLRGFFIK